MHLEPVKLQPKQQTCKRRKAKAIAERQTQTARQQDSHHDFENSSGRQLPDTGEIKHHRVKGRRWL